jgi:glycosyltransferase involved in cell wall biosynthesis
MKISIITPSYNSGKYLERAIQSVLAQDYFNWEHIVIDGGSKDETVDILKKHPHIKWVSEPDKGQSDAMNKGFAMSNGDIIVYLNADDWFEEGAFSHVIKCFGKDNCDMVFGDLKIVFESTGDLEIRKPATDYKTVIQFWNCRFPANPVSYFYKRKVQANYTFPIDEHQTMDLDFIFYATLKFKTAYLPFVLGTFYIDGSNKTSNIDGDIYEIQKKAYLRHCREYNHKLLMMYYLSKFKQAVKDLLK